MLDVGQGDAILLQPGGGLPILVDAGPAGAGLGDALGAAGVERLGAVVVTHDQSDHSGGLAELFARLPVRRLVLARGAPSLEAAARGAGAAVLRAGAGTELRSGALRLAVLWPPRELATAPGRLEDPNTRSLVLLARWRRFAMLLTGDAEAEAVPLDPGPVDVLKVSHHGSEDAGLEELLRRTGPRLAVISVGSVNPFGHPAGATLRVLAAAGTPVLRTDRDGTIVLDVARRLAVSAEG